MDNEIIYRDIEDDGLISFCQKNLTHRAKEFLGVIEDTDGTTKVAKENYPYLVQMYLEVGAVSSGDFNGMLDIESEIPKSNMLM
jgi:hypothetical protein